MTPFSATRLSYRSVLRLTGTDRLSFLQALISNDVHKARENEAIYAALLTPQGKFLHDLFILASENALLIDCEAARAEDLMRKLSAYRLRSPIEIENLGDSLQVWAVWNPQALPCLGADMPEFFSDPRLPALGLRGFLPPKALPEGVSEVAESAYDLHRLTLGVAEGSRDLEVGHDTLAEGNFDALNGIDWKKGCYLGQELTARMKYRGLAKKRLFPARLKGDAPPFGAPLLLNGVEVGEMRSSSGTRALVLLKNDAAAQAQDEQTSLMHGTTRIFPETPDWMQGGAPASNSRPAGRN